MVYSQARTAALPLIARAQPLKSIPFAQFLPTPYHGNKNSFSLKKKSQNSNIPIHLVHAKLVSLEGRHLSNDTVITERRELNDRFLHCLSCLEFRKQLLSNTLLYTEYKMLKGETVFNP